MARARTYKLTKWIYKSMRSRYGDEYRCSRCDRIFQFNDTVRSQPSKKRSHVRWYHLECYEELLI